MESLLTLIVSGLVFTHFIGFLLMFVLLYQAYKRK